jgi:putative transposase
MSAHADWITKDELLRLTGWDRSTLFRKQASGEVRTRIAESARNGKPRREYDASSLPAEAQTKRLQQKIAGAPLVLVKASSTAVATLPAPGSDTIIRALATLDAEAKKQAEQRLEIIGPMIDFQNKTNGHKPLFTVGTNHEITSLSGIVKHISATLGYGERTLWNWWNAYKEGGPGALADRPRSDRNISRFFKDHKQAAEFATNKFLNERLSVRIVHSALLREWNRLQLNAEDAPPSYETVRVFLNGLSPLITAVARQGETVYNNDFAPYLLRDIAKVRVNQYWISDHMAHDVFVRNIDLQTGGPVFGELPLNAPFRPWLTCIVDMRSRRVVGSVWCVTPSSNTISSALRSAMRSFGLPAVFYIDNGKDYKKLGKREPELSPDAQGVLVRLGVRSQHCLPKHPQSKQIESFFRTVHKQFDVLWPSYCGSSPADRPEQCALMEREHKKLLAEGRGDESPLPAASDFIQGAAIWLQTFNTTFKHSGQGMNKRTPQQIFDAELPPQKRAPVNPADVAQLFWDRQTRVVSEGGCVQLFNARYEPADAEAAAALMLEIKREVLVACDPLNVGEAIALAQDGRFLGNLRAQELLVHGETSAEQIRASMRARRNVLHALKHFNASLAHNRALAGDATELEALARRASAVSAPKPIIHALPVPKAVNAQPQQRLRAGDIADSFLEE